MDCIGKILSVGTYPGRGIIVGKSKDGKYAMTAYFIMGRSENSRNRVFVEDGEGIRTKAFDESRLLDPSLIIYSPVKVIGKKTIITNGDQTDTIFDFINAGKCFNAALMTREFEPDAPNYTPRISTLINVEMEKLHFRMSILKSDDGNPDCCNRYFYDYDNIPAGEGRFIHTYKEDVEPLPSFEGEPVRVSLDGDIDEFSENIWKSLNEDNKVSLFTRFIEIKTGKYETRIINKNK
ncbi:MAG: IMP cyclohydrolase [Catonella sp.]|uniref:IMP cyclohydrolase n=1 Tax=Catonella sp. TaxID=2382125 RepID=UPI003FA16C33